MSSRETSRTGPIAAEFSVDDDGRLNLEDFEVGHEPEGDDDHYMNRVRSWFLESWSDHEEQILEAGGGRKLFIVCCQLVSYEYNSIDYGYDYDQELVIEAVL